MNARLRFFRPLLLFAILFVCFAPKTLAQSGIAYFAEGNFGRIRSVHLDGTNLQTVVSGAFAPTAVDIDVPNQHLYWTDLTNDKISRSNLDGSSIVDLVTNVIDPSGLSLDLGAGKMYWTTIDPFGGTVQRANLDGTNVETLLTGLVGGAWAIEVNPVGAGKMYFAGRVCCPDGEVHRANLDGTSPQVIYSDANDNINGVTLDVANGKVFWTSIGPSHAIRSANLDGTNVQTLTLPPLTQPFGIDYVPSLSRVVFGTKQGANGLLAMSAADGSQYQLIISGVEVLDVAVIPLQIPEPATIGLFIIGTIATVIRRGFCLH